MLLFLLTASKYLFVVKLDSDIKAHCLVCIKVNDIDILRSVYFPSATTAVSSRRDLRTGDKTTKVTAV